MVAPTQQAAGPPATLTMVMPNTGPEAGGTDVTLTGTNFTGTTSVTFGTGSATNMVVVSNTSITCTTPPGTGTVDVTAVGTGGGLLAQGFMYVPAPTGGTAPSAPTAVAAIPGDGSATVSWTAPPPATPALSSYTVTPYLAAATPTPLPGSSVSGNPPDTSLEVYGLVNGSTYTFTVMANNNAGTSVESMPSNPVTPVGAVVSAEPTVGHGAQCSICKYFSPVSTPVGTPTSTPAPANRRSSSPQVVAFGNCRHNPPVVNTSPSGRAIGVGWPTCQGTDWCGEFEYVKSTEPSAAT